NVLKMSREGVLYGLRSVLNDVRKGDAPVRKDGLRVRSNGDWIEVAVEAIPLTSAPKRHYLILFHEQGGRQLPKPAERPERRGKRLRKQESLVQLEQELQSSRDYLQSIIQELEAANEELQSANEEILSAKEELQSTNEELNTVNEELQGRNEELSRVNSDLLNLLSSVQIAIVIVASDLRIRRFTPMAERILNLIPSDVGRPIGHIQPNIDCPELEQLIGQVIDTVVPCEREVRDRQGNWYSLRLRPYKNVENRIDGAVLALFDLQRARALEAEGRRVRELVGQLAEAISQPVAVLDGTLSVRTVNGPFREAFGANGPDLMGKPFLDVADGPWKEPQVRNALEAIARGDLSQADLELRSDGVGEERVVVRASRIGSAGEPHATILLVMDVPSGGSGSGSVH